MEKQNKKRVRKPISKLTLKGSEQDLIKFDEQFSGVYTQYSTGTSFAGKVGKTHEEIA